MLVTHLGEAPARLINTATDIAKNVSQQSGNQLKQFFKHLAEQELQLTVSADEVDEFLDGVDTLRADTERLSLRIQRIQSKS